MEEDLRKLRVRFQRALLGLLRTEDRSSEFLALEDTLRALSDLAESTVAKEVWTQCREWIESIRTSQERPKPGYIRFLRMVDQSLKIWLDGGQIQFERREIPRLREALNALSEGEAVPPQGQPEGGEGRTEQITHVSKQGTPDTADPDQSGEERLVELTEPAPAEIGSVLSGLASHPAWGEGLWERPDADAGHRQEQPSDDRRIGGDSAETPAARPRQPKDRVPLSNLFPRLDRIVLQTGRDLARPTALIVHGGSYLDRSVLKGLLQPLELIVKNAIYHGIETIDERVAASKPRVGQIAVTLHRSTETPRLEVETDGLAIDFDRLRRKGEEMGLLAPDAELSRADLLQCLTADGFSTAHSATQIAGYGVGLDAARQALEALGGRLHVGDNRDQGLTFVLYLPAGCCGPPELTPV